MRWPCTKAAAAGMMLSAMLTGLAVGCGARPGTSGGIPTAVVERGDLDMRIHASGELRAKNTMILSAPQIGDGTLRITYLAKTGALVERGERVIEFDPSEQRYNREQSRSQLLQAEQEIIKARADAAVQAAEDQVALLKARYDVRRAELDVQQNELKSQIEAQKNLLARNEAKRALAQLEQDITSHARNGQALIALALEKSHKAALSMEEAQRNIEKMRVLSPIGGLMAIDRNGGNEDIVFEGMPLPYFRVGDQVHPGTGIAQVIDPGEMEVVAKVGERDRDHIRVGQQAEIELDALPGYRLRGVVTTLSGMSSRQFWEEDAGGRFEVSISLADRDGRLRPGLTAQILILSDPRKDVLYLPRQALVWKEGQHLVYVKKGSSYQPRPVKILSENESRAAIEGVSVGSQVALLDPTAPTRRTPPAAASTPGQGAP